jgi:hypothetical protein
MLTTGRASIFFFDSKLYRYSTVLVSYPRHNKNRLERLQPRARRHVVQMEPAHYIAAQSEMKAPSYLCQ